MCTVTYIPKENNGFTITSNRDEVVGRNAFLPGLNWYNGNKLYFPRDPKAGGTWFAMNENGRICCLLNGAFEKHVPQEYHTRSRGHILLDLVSSPLKPELFFDIEDLKNVQPFTIITLDYWNGELNYFSEIRWDGENRHFGYPDTTSSHIWSSATLYNKEARLKRKKWFVDFLDRYEYEPDDEIILGFHKSKISQDDSINILMNRGDGLQTVSITRVSASEESICMDYVDLVNDKKRGICIKEKDQTTVLS